MEVVKVPPRRSLQGQRSVVGPLDEVPYRLLDPGEAHLVGIPQHRHRQFLRVAQGSPAPDHLPSDVLTDSSCADIQ